MRKVLFFVTLIISVTLIVSGCARQVPLGGRITFSDNGEPLTEGSIGFVRGSVQARSDIDADGRYNLGFAADGDGLPKGEYQIYIQAVRIEYQYGPNKNRDGNPEVIDRKEIPLIAKKYSSAETSGLTFTVDGKNSTFDIQVERPKK
jgi:hypothetical protein